MLTHENGLRSAGQVSKRQKIDIERILLHFGIVLASLSMISFVPYAFDNESMGGMWLWISPAILCIVCIGTAFRIIRADIQMVASPVFWVLIASAVYWGFGPLIYTFGSVNSVEYLEEGYRVGVSELFITNMLDSVGMLALVIGLVFGRRLFGRRPKGWVRCFHGVDALHVAGVLAVIGLTAKFGMFLPRVFGLIGTQSSTLMDIQVLSKAALMILAYQSATRGGKTTAWFVLLFVVEFLTAGLVGSKLEIFVVVIVALVGWVLAVRKVSSIVKGVIALGLLQLILQPLVSGYRMMDRSSIGIDYATSVAVAGKLMAQSFSDLMHGVNKAIEMQPQGWWIRLCYAPDQTFAMQEYDSGRPGSPWGDFAMSFIPRFLWHDKPLITPAKNFSILVSNNPDNNRAPGFFGEGYWYGGWLGLILVGLYTGIILSGVDRVSMEVISCRAWTLMPLVVVGLRMGYRIDGWFSGFMFESVWYVLFAICMFYFSAFYLTMIRHHRVTTCE